MEYSEGILVRFGKGKKHSSYRISPAYTSSSSSSTSSLPVPALPSCSSSVSNAEGKHCSVDGLQSWKKPGEPDDEDMGIDAESEMSQDLLAVPPVSSVAPTFGFSSSQGSCDSIVFTSSPPESTVSTSRGKRKEKSQISFSTASLTRSSSRTSLKKRQSQHQDQPQDKRKGTKKSVSYKSLDLVSGPPSSSLAATNSPTNDDDATVGYEAGDGEQLDNTEGGATEVDCDKTGGKRKVCIFH